MHDPLEQRLTVLDAEPDSCSLTCGTTNFGDDVFLNPWGFMSDLYVQAQEREVVPEFELFDLGHVHALRRLLDTHGLPFGGRVHVDFVTGVPGGMPATTAALMAGVAMLPAEVTSWSATGIGRGHLPIMAAALSAGGHLRVGMEDNVVFARGQVVQHNDELVARAAELATVMQRPPLGTDAGPRAARGQGPARALSRRPTARSAGGAGRCGRRRLTASGSLASRPRCGRRWACRECALHNRSYGMPCVDAFGFPAVVNEKAARVVAGGVALITATALLTGLALAERRAGRRLRAAGRGRAALQPARAAGHQGGRPAARVAEARGRAAEALRPDRRAWCSRWLRRASWWPGCRP